MQEFFQLLMRELFDANFGMFRMDPDLRTFWFRASSLDLDIEFELVGLLLALAIYNNHILDISFPLVVYKYAASFCGTSLPEAFPVCYYLTCTCLPPLPAASHLCMVELSRAT